MFKDISRFCGSFWDMPFHSEQKHVTPVLRNSWRGYLFNKKLFIKALSDAEVHAYSSTIHNQKAL